MKLGKQEQAGDSPRTAHSAFGPQGDGTHGLVGAIGSAGNKVFSFIP